MEKQDEIYKKSVKKLSEKAGELCADIVHSSFNEGYEFGKQNICAFLDECACTIDFGNDPPSVVIKELSKIIREKDKNNGKV